MSTTDATTYQPSGNQSSDNLEDLEMALSVALLLGIHSGNFSLGDTTVNQERITAHTRNAKSKSYKNLTHNNRPFQENVKKQSKRQIYTFPKW
jgi:hypothetical protein